MKKYLIPVLIVAFFAAWIGGLVWFIQHREAQDEAEARAWRSSMTNCKRTGFTADGRRGLWTCADGVVYIEPWAAVGRR